MGLALQVVLRVVAHDAADGAHGVGVGAFQLGPHHIDVEIGILGRAVGQNLHLLLAGAQLHHPVLHLAEAVGEHAQHLVGGSGVLAGQLLQVGVVVVGHRGPTEVAGAEGRVAVGLRFLLGQKAGLAVAFAGHGDGGGHARSAGADDDDVELLVPGDVGRIGGSRPAGAGAGAGVRALGRAPCQTRHPGASHGQSRALQKPASRRLDSVVLHDRSPSRDDDIAPGAAAAPDEGDSTAPRACRHLPKGMKAIAQKTLFRSFT